MQVKHFFIRLTREHLHLDEQKLNEFIQRVAVDRTASQLVHAEPANYWSILVFFNDVPSGGDPKKGEESFDVKDLTEEEQARYEVLKHWRSDVSMQESLPTYFVATNAMLGAIARLNPSDINMLHKIKGMGERKIDKYGGQIIDLLQSL